MVFWHELPVETAGWVFPPGPGSRVGAEFRGNNPRENPFFGRFLRYEGNGDIPTGPWPHWRRNPEGWFELWPHEPLIAYTMDEARARYLRILPDVEYGAHDEWFDRRPCQARVIPELVKELEHESLDAMARIYMYPDSLFAVHYFVKYFSRFVEEGALGPEWEWGGTWMKDDEGQRIRTLADDLSSAEQIALIELNHLYEEDAEKKRR